MKTTKTVLRYVASFVIFMIIWGVGCYLVGEVAQIKSIPYAMMFGYVIASFGLWVSGHIKPE